MKLRKVIASALVVMTVFGMISTTAFAYEDNNAQQEVSETLSSSSKSSKKTPEPSGASPHSKETTALVAKGDCGENGDNVKWSLYESGTLYIYGSGNMKNYYYWGDVNETPYCDYQEQIVNVVVESGVKSVGDCAFSGFENLKSILIPNGVISIGKSVCDDCTGLVSITIPEGVTSIESYAFSYCESLTSITIPSSVTSIGGYAFSYCSSLKSAEINDGVTSIIGWAFDNCTSLTSITIPNSVTDIGEFAFAECTSLTSIKMPENITSIPACMFWGCSSLKSVTIPNSVTDMDNGAFARCSDLTSITIPTSLKHIGDTAFEECYSLKDVYYAGTKEQWDCISIGGYADLNAPLENANIHYNCNSAAPLSNTSKVSNSNPNVGSSVKITGSATGGTGNYTYEFYYKRQGANSWSKFGSSYQTANTATLKPSSAGTFIVRTYAKDGKSAKVKDFTITFTPPLTNKTTVTTTTPKVGTAVKINGSATGGTGTYTYEFYYKRQGASSWSTFGTNYRTDTTATLKPSSAGSFDVRVYVKESSGKTAVKNFVITYSK